MAVDVLRGEVQQWSEGRWRTVLTASGIPVQDNRRAEPGRPAVQVFVDPAFPGLIGVFDPVDGYCWVVP